MTSDTPSNQKLISIPLVEKAIIDMLKMQDSLNVMTNGQNWRSGVTKAGKVINWQRCIYMETAELIDSYPWKHWKAIDAKADMENARVELVDIWHFLLSLVLEHHHPEQAAEHLLQAYTQHQARAVSAENVESRHQLIEQINVFEELMRQALRQDSELLPLAKVFFDACQMAELDFSALYEIYMAKNVLNKFRQDHGYKEGHYIKVWNGKEDNEVMFEIIAELPQFDSEVLYDALKQHYRDVLL